MDDDGWGIETHQHPPVSRALKKFLLIPLLWSWKLLVISLCFYLCRQAMKTMLGCSLFIACLVDCSTDHSELEIIWREMVDDNSGFQKVSASTGHAGQPTTLVESCWLWHQSSRRGRRGVAQRILPSTMIVVWHRVSLSLTTDLPIPHICSFSMYFQKVELIVSRITNSRTFSLWRSSSYRILNWPPTTHESWKVWWWHWNLSFCCIALWSLAYGPLSSNIRCIAKDKQDNLKW